MLNETLESKLKKYRLSNEEYEKVKQLLGREPNTVEWPIFSALWSEHCSYKSSKIHLRKFSYRNSSTPDMDGENAGVVDLGMGEKVAFKMESHNHPSFIEPVQGAATGVGGILRDIFTMGARPIMSANYLCFGEVTADRMPYLMKGVVKGISSYGNCVGVPTVTGQTNYHPKYNKNILVNALNVGYFGPEQVMALSKAKGVGCHVVYVGAKTGRDGVHGAAMASASFDNDSEAKKPNVQIGDPFYEKLLIEACLEVLAKDYVVAMQDMGAAGLTSSSFEMASKGNIGLEIDLKKVPLRDSTMSPEEILLSESQERMLLICEPKNFQALQQVFKKWSLDAVILGQVFEKRSIKLMWGAETLTNIDPDLAVEQAPRYERPFNAWASVNKVANLPVENVEPQKLIQHLLKTMQLNSCEWIYNQYDQRVGARTAMACESSVAVCKLDHSGRGLSLAVGCRPDIMEMDAELGALDSVYYPAFQMALKGFNTLAITDCLNFGNPQKKEIMTEFVASVDAIVKASKQLDAPVISGNVSFYNETLDQNIVSTPAIGMVGLRDSVENLISDKFSDPFENIYMVQFPWVESNLMVSKIKNLTKPQFVQTNLEVSDFIKKTVGLAEFLKKSDVKINSIKAVGLGGLLTTCLKMSTAHAGFDLSFNMAGVSDFELCKDRFYAFLVTSKEAKEKIEKLIKRHYDIAQIEVTKIGETTQGDMVVTSSYKIDKQQFQTEFSKQPKEVKRAQ